MRIALSLLARLVIVAGFGAGVGLSADHVYTTIQSATSKQIVAHWDVDAAYWACLTSQVKSVVPPGHTVWLSQQAPNAPSSQKSLWKATAGVWPISSASFGVIDLYLVGAPEGQGCLDVNVRAVFPTGVILVGKGTVPQADWARWIAAGSPRTP